MPPSFLQFPFEIRDQILYHVFFPVSPRSPESPDSPCPFPPTEIYPNIQPHEDEQTNYRTALSLSVLQTCRQLLREGELLLYRHLKFNLLFHDWETDYRFRGEKSAIRFLERLNPRRRQLIRHLELKCSETEQVPPLREWMYLLYFLEIECHSLKVLRLWCPAEVEEALDCFRGEREWVRKVLQISLFEREEQVED